MNIRRIIRRIIAKSKEWLSPAPDKSSNPQFSIDVKLSDYPLGTPRPFVALAAVDYYVVGARVDENGQYRFEGLKPNVEYTVAPLAISGKSWVPPSGKFTLTPENPTAIFESRDPAARPNPWLSVVASATFHR